MSAKAQPKPRARQRYQPPSVVVLENPAALIALDILAQERGLSQAETLEKIVWEAYASIELKP